MRDIYTESVIPVPSGSIYRVLKYALIVLLLLSVAAAGYFGLLLLIPSAVLGWLLYRVMQKSDSEYEYVHTNDCFDVDLVIRKSGRKSLISVNLKQVLLIARADSTEMAAYKNVPATDYAGDCSREMLYEMVYTVSGTKKKLQLQLDDAMHKSLKQWIPDKVK